MSVHPCSCLPLPTGLGRSSMGGSHQAGGWVRRNLGVTLLPAQEMAQALLCLLPGWGLLLRWQEARAPMPGTGLTPGMGRAGEAPLDWESLAEQMGSWWYGFSFLFQTLRVCSLTAHKRRQGCSFIVEEQSHKYFHLLFLGVLVFISHGWYAVLRGVTSKFCGLFKATKAPHRFGSSMYRSWRHVQVMVLFAITSPA